jgi:tetratricopeptide (TPR) repeat protein
MAQPYCFVLMPFGIKSDPSGTTVNFDRVYAELIEPAIRATDLDPIRADNEMVGGIIHKPMFERLVLCEYAVADLTMANANVYYELGVRHAVRPWSTVLLHAGATRMPFDVAMLRALPYRLSDDGLPGAVEADRAELIKWLLEAREAKARAGSATDSPLFQLLEGFPDAYRMDRIAHSKTDIFRKQVAYSETIKARLTEARGLARGDRARGRQAIATVRADLGKLIDVETGILIDLFLSYRAVEDWAAMIALVDEMPPVVRETVMVQEQLALALNREGVATARPELSERAERLLTSLIERRGSSSETYGLLGRVYKDRWEAASKHGDALLAKGFLSQAISAYRRGFEADWRDAYPGINAVTLMEMREPPDPEQVRLLPIVAYAVERRVAGGKPDYWDIATVLELSILARDEAKSRESHEKAVPLIREADEPETTARNLRLIREARLKRGEAIAWADEIERDLARRSGA